MAETSFSMEELRAAGKVNLACIESLAAEDGVRLAYRRYAPSSPRAAILFYHGGGAHSGAGYQFIGNGLQNQYEMLVYTPDIRGHGSSDGPRGDAPGPKQIWEDITTFIRLIRSEYPRLPLFLGGHSSGAGLALNYASQPEHEPVSGYILLSPQLGTLAKTDRPSQATPFAKVDSPAFGAYAMSGGREHGHDYAVQFNYPAEVLAADRGLVASITVNMSVALIPSAPGEQFAALDRPFGLWIGSKDELFLPDKVLAFAGIPGSGGAGTQAGIIPGAKHISVLVKAHETIGPWIAKLVQEKKV
jgi:acylglycerol lipase